MSFFKFNIIGKIQKHNRSNPLLVKMENTQEHSGNIESLISTYRRNDSAANLSRYQGHGHAEMGSNDVRYRLDGNFKALKRSGKGLGSIN